MKANTPSVVSFRLTLGSVRGDLCQPVLAGW